MVVKKGLRSRVQAATASSRERSTEEQALALLGAIISQSGGESGSTSQSAPVSEIFAPLAFGEAFRLEVKLRSTRAPSQLEIGLYQGASRSQGYALTYRNATQKTSGKKGAVELSRRTSYGTNVVSQRSCLAALEDGRVHTLAWSRDRDGDMQVSLDGRVLMEGREVGVTGAFDGVRLRNLGGEFTVRALTLHTGE